MNVFKSLLKQTLHLLLLRSEKAMEQVRRVRAMVDRKDKGREQRKKSQAGESRHSGIGKDHDDMSDFHPSFKQTIKLILTRGTAIPDKMKYRYGEGYPEVELDFDRGTFSVSAEELLGSEKAMEQVRAVRAMVDRRIKERERQKKSQAGAGNGSRPGRKSQAGEGNGRPKRKSQVGAGNGRSGRKSRAGISGVRGKNQAGGRGGRPKKKTNTS